MARVNVGFSETETWNPEVGDKIEGSITRKDEVMTQYGPRPLLEIATDGKPTTIWCGTAVLNRLWDKAEIGYYVTIVYEGLVENAKTGREFKSYAIELDDLT